MNNNKIKRKSEIEFIAIMASLMALSALSIDALLPGLKDIATSINIADAKDNQLMVTMIFLGLGFGQLISGPLSDSLGRKTVIYIGYVVFAAASVLCIFSTSMEIMLVGRVLQGIGLSAPRTVSMAIVRDRFSGDKMAKIMSFVTVIFIIVPVIAPSFGKLMLGLFGWQSIFYSQIGLGLLVIIWLAKRQPETLKSAYRKKMKFAMYRNGIKEFLKHKQSVVFTLVLGFVSASFLAYISASQQIFQDQYGLIDEFPFIFSGIALGIGLATFLNGTFVERFGMLKMASTFITVLTLIALSYVVLFYAKGNPSSTILIIYFAFILFPLGFIFGNANALAMQPIGHIAGIGAAIVGFTSTVMAVPLAMFMGRFIDTTALPIFVGFSLSGLSALLLIRYFKYKGKKYPFYKRKTQKFVRPLFLKALKRVLKNN